MGQALPPWDMQRPPPVPVRRFTIDEYHRLGEAGVLTNTDQVELLEGWIVPKMVHNPPHDNAVELVDEALRPLLPAGWRMRVQSSITTADSEPEPDLAIVKGSPRNRQARHPASSEVAVVIEVADTSLETDRGTKARLYARAGIPVYWVVNLVERQVEIHTVPASDPPTYRHIEVARPSTRVALVIDGQPVASVFVDDLLP